jgi:MoaA/NifB/PqqE/SkfB family radical SAM enzyme
VPGPLSGRLRRVPARGVRDTLRLVLAEGGPGFCQFALTNACNANCGFCGFARDSLRKADWEFVPTAGAREAIDILARNGIRYLVLTGGEPTLHPDLLPITRHACDAGMKVMLVTNAGLLKPHRIEAMVEAGISSVIISVDAASRETHEANRGLPGVCERIVEANAVLRRIGIEATASVTMSRLVDYAALPDFLRSLGFRSVTFSYPLTHLNSNFLGYSSSSLVNYSEDELLDAFEAIKRLKRRICVVNPLPSIEEMQRFLRGERQRFGCLGGHRFFYLDWKLMLWRCHFWEAPMCSIYEFDETKLIRDNCTRCMIDCYRDASVMQHVAVSVHDAYQAARDGKLAAAARAVFNRRTAGSLRAVAEQLPWLLRF